MAKMQLSHAITIVDCVGAAPGSWAQMKDKEGKIFIKGITSAYKKLMELSTGREIINQINQSGKTATIFQGTSEKNGAAMPATQGSQSSVDGTVVYFLPRHKVQTRKALAADGGLNPKLKATTKTAMAGINAPTKKADTAPVFQRFITRLQAKYPTPLTELARVTGHSTQDIQDMAAGTKGMDAETFFKICFAFYDFLEPGPGVDTVVRFYAVAEIPDHILLGHELIHAWRLMKGKRLVMGGSNFDEEAMTVGLGPFMGWKFTENQLRCEAGLPFRMSYGALLDSSTKYSGAIQAGVEQLQSELLTLQAKLKQEAADYGKVALP